MSWVIAGLGNPGAKYDRTPHNLGYEVVDLLARRHGLEWAASRKWPCLAAAGSFRGEKLYFVKPTTYMNLSGDAVQPFADYYNVVAERVLVVCDDVNLPYGRLRLRARGTDGGQKGLRHILGRLGTNDVPRLRLGCAPPRQPRDLASYVLSPIWGDAVEVAAIVVEVAADCVETVISEGVDPAMTRYNGWTVEEERPA